MSRGHDRERALVHDLRASGWFAMRSPASKGVADVIALKAGHRPRMIEVKSTTRSAFVAFGPAERDELRLAAELAGAEAWLVHWPKRSRPKWIRSTDWP